ncbi:YciI-like protein [Pleomorphovibrio marinus]|uniref:YciI-like protein n=1 Tax=Pleomorphovibrio marinus TaxID=2164132 RepID=UPI000E0A50C6|nr:YciI-like protein [Pleomorphovibrio marinus]
MKEKFFLLTYDTVLGYLEKRKPYRKEHLALAREFYENGHLLMGGALVSPADKAVLIFKGKDEGIATEFVNKDPYVKMGLVRSYEIREWNVVVGG